MKKLNLLLNILFGLMIISCSSDEENQTETETSVKKLITENITDTHGNFERTFTYNSGNNVIEINNIYSGDDQFIATLTKTVFTYQNNIIVSANSYEDGDLFLTDEFNYSNGELIEIISYNPDGTEYSKREYNYNSNGRINSLNYYVEEQLQQILNLTYSINNNINIAEDGTDNFEFQFDQNPSSYDNFSYSNKIIFTYVSLFENFSENNLIRQTTTYNENSANEDIYIYDTTIQYDSDSYPIEKTTIQTYNGVQSTRRVVTYEYE